MEPEEGGGKAWQGGPAAHCSGTPMPEPLGQIVLGKPLRTFFCLAAASTLVKRRNKSSAFASSMISRKLD